MLLHSTTVSVIIPLYNAEPFIAQTIESVLAQTVAPHQVIVIDDGSTDQSVSVARRYQKYIQLIEQPNVGGAHTRNRGVALAHGDFLAFLDSDDYWMPDKLALQLQAFYQSPNLEAVFGQIQQTHTLETATLPNHAGMKWFGMNVQNGWHLDTLLIRRPAFQRIGAFDATWMIDTVEWLWRARRLQLCTAILPDLLAWRRIHGNNHSVQARQRAQREYLRLVSTVRQQHKITSYPEV